MTEKSTDAISILFIENQEIFAVFYRSVFESEDGYRILGIQERLTSDLIENTLPECQPDILIIGIKELNQDVIDQVTVMSIKFPRMGIVLLFDVYEAEGIKLLRKVVNGKESGMAAYLKSSITKREQIFNIVNWVHDRHYIFDPALTSLLLTEKHTHTFLKGLTKRELEVLSLISEGCTNSAIAARLYIDIKTVRHHINSIYSKIHLERESQHKHPRVNAARLYLETTGDLIPSDK